MQKTCTSLQNNYKSTILGTPSLNKSATTWANLLFDKEPFVPDIVLYRQTNLHEDHPPKAVRIQPFTFPDFMLEQVG